MQIDNDIKLGFDDVLIRPKRSTMTSRSEVDLTRTIKFKHSSKTWTGIPIIAANMDTIGTHSMAISLQRHSMITALHKFIDDDKLLKIFSDESLRNNIFYTMGITDDDFAKFIKNNHLIISAGFNGIPMICIDVANGYTQRFIDFIKKVRNISQDSIIMAGNVVTNEMTEEIILAGADIAKCGIGPGSVCSTRLMTGIGYPQLSAIIECADAAHGLGGHICGDGGCKTAGDIPKAFGAGADFVMLGGMLSGHDESELHIPRKLSLKPSINNNPNLMGDPDFSELVNFIAGNKTNISADIMAKYREFIEMAPVENATLKFYGMSSREAMVKHYGKVNDYRASEGECIEVPYKGPVDNTIQEILGGLRSACTYIGCRKLKELPKRTTFIRVNKIK